MRIARVLDFARACLFVLVLLQWGGAAGAATAGGAGAPLVAVRADHMILDLATLDDRILVGTQSGRVDVYDRRTGDVLTPLFVAPEVVGRAFAPTVRSLAMSPSGDELVVVTSDDSLHRFTLGESAESAEESAAEPTEPAEARQVPGLMIARYLDEERILLADMRGELSLLDTRSGAEKYRKQLEYDPIYAMALSPDGSRLAVAFRSSRVQVVEPETGEVLHILKGHLDSVFDVEWLTDHEVLTAGKDKRLLAWDLRESDPKPRALYRGDHFVTAVGVDRVNSRLALTLDGFDVGVMQLSDRSIEQRLEGHTAPVQKLEFVDDGRQLISAGHDARVFVWQLEPSLEPNLERR